MVTTCELIKRVYLSGDNDGSDVPMVIRSKLWVLKKYQAPFTSWSQPQTSSGGSGGGGGNPVWVRGFNPQGGGGTCQYIQIPADRDTNPPLEEFRARTPPPPLEKFLDPPLTIELLTPQRISYWSHKGHTKVKVSGWVRAIFVNLQGKRALIRPI